MRTIFWHNRWSGAVSHVPNRRKRSNLQKRRQNILCFGVWTHTLFWGVKTYSVLWSVVRCRQVTHKVPKIVKNLCPTVLQLKWVISTWWEKNLTVSIFSMLRDTLELILWKKADRKWRIFFAKGALIGKSIFQIQRINAVHGRCSNFGVLGNVPSNSTRSVRRRIVL